MEYLKKILVWIFIFSLAAYPSESKAERIDIFDYPSPTEAIDQIMGDLGVDKDELKKTIQRDVNTSGYKMNPPAVTLTFVPTSPINGKELSAMAAATYFFGNPKQMYYTWYLKHDDGSGTGKDAEGRKTKNGNTDWNKDDDIDIEDYKIEAARILARGITDKEFDYSGLRRGGDEDKDGYAASFGGEDQKGRPEHCYARNIEAGTDEEIGCKHLFPEDLGESDGKLTNGEEEFWGTDPRAKDTDNDGVMDEKALVGLGMISFKWIYKTGDKVGVAVEGVQGNTDSKDSSLKTMWAMPKNSCETEDLAEQPTTPATEQRSVYRFDKHGSQYEDQISLSVDCTGRTEENFVFNNPGGTIGTHAYNCPPENGVDVNNLVCSAVTGRNSCGRCFDGSFQWKAGAENAPHNLVVLLHENFPDNCDVCIGEDKIDCGTFTGRMNDDSKNLPSTDPEKCLEANYVDPTEGTTEKKIDVKLFYSPQYPINDPTATEKLKNNADDLTIRADVSNVENKSFAKYKWELQFCNEKGGECLEMKPKEMREYLNLIRTEGIGMESIKLRLMMDDAFRQKRSIRARLTVFESTDSVSGKKGEGETIIPLQTNSAQIVPKRVIVHKQTLGVPEPKADLDLDIDLTTTRYGLLNGLEKDCPEKTCPTVKNEIIGLYIQPGTEDVFDNNTVFSWYLDGKPLLAGNGSLEDRRRAYFPILKGTGEKYSVKVDVINSVDGKENKTTLTRDFGVFDPAIRISPDCESGSDCNRLKLGEFITNPAYTSVAGPQYRKEDFSQDKFEAKEGKIITIEPSSTFDISALKRWDASEERNIWNLEWSVDGELIDQELAFEDVGDSFPYIDNDNGNLYLPINKLKGAKYTITAKALYTQPDPERNALFDIWNVSPNSFYETTVEDSIEIEVVEDAALLPYSGPKKIMASLFAGAPEYLNFLFRIFLTLGLILFLSNLSLVMFPKSRS